MKKSIFNFYAGPATLPRPVLEEVQKKLLDFNSTGMSVMEISHRSKEYEEVHFGAENRIKKLLNLNDEYKVLFLQGGASTQFAMVPMNLLAANETADYILTGSWSQKAYKEALQFGKVNIAASTETDNFNRIPSPEEIKITGNPKYIHITSNNTIFGTQWQSFPDFGDIPVVADMSSDILSRRFEANKFGIIYAGAQKNLGPAGVTVVAIRTDLLKESPRELPTMFNYRTHIKKDSLFNTPPTFSIYVLSLVLKWLEDLGGVEEIEKTNRKKAQIIYNEIDESDGFYRGHALPDSRSLMNITFRLPSEELEKKFVTEATDKGLIGLKGHRSVGGLRASIYNAMSMEGCEALALFMKEFRAKN